MRFGLAGTGLGTGRIAVRNDLPCPCDEGYSARMTVRRMLVVVVGAVAPAVLYVLVFANQWVADALVKHDVPTDHGLGPVLVISQSPGWRFTGHGTGLIGGSGKLVLAQDFSTFLLLIVLGAIVFGGARALSVERGLFSALVLGWWATFMASALTGFVRGFLYAEAFPYPSGEIGGALRQREISNAIWSQASSGAQFGLWFGWLGGVGALLAVLVLRARTRPGPVGGQGPVAQRPPAVPGYPGVPPAAQYAPPGYPQWAANVPAPAPPAPSAQVPPAAPAPAPAPEEKGTGGEGLEPPA